MPVTYASLKNKDIDVFLGNWMPTMEADIEPYRDDRLGRDDRRRTSRAPSTRSRCRTTPADAGLKDFADIAKFKDKLDGKIYGIEPGNDGNRLILDMIAKPTSSASAGFELVESSEQACWPQAERAEKSSEWIVFLGWEPHPMNATIKMTYLDRRRRRLRPELRRRHGLHQRARRLLDDARTSASSLTNLKFTLPMENEIMGAILDDGEDAERGRGRVAEGQSRRARRLARRRHHLRRRRRGRGGQDALGADADSAKTAARRTAPSRRRDARQVPRMDLDRTDREHKIPVGAVGQGVLRLADRPTPTGFFDGLADGARLAASTA